MDTWTFKLDAICKSANGCKLIVARDNWSRWNGWTRGTGGGGTGGTGRIVRPARVGNTVCLESSMVNQNMPLNAQNAVLPLEPDKQPMVRGILARS